MAHCLSTQWRRFSDSVARRIFVLPLGPGQHNRSLQVVRSVPPRDNLVDYGRHIFLRIRHPRGTECLDHCRRDRLGGLGSPPVIVIKANLLGSLPVYDPPFAEVRRAFRIDKTATVPGNRGSLNARSGAGDCRVRNSVGAALLPRNWRSAALMRRGSFSPEPSSFGPPQPAELFDPSVP